MSRRSVARSVDLPAPGLVAGGVLVVGGLLAGLAFPKLLTSGRRAAKAVIGETFTSGVPGQGASRADPANGRPA
ncbi:hypothetical protein ACUXST_002315 [Sphingomonas sp. F9_3S_D5_B_2]